MSENKIQTSITLQDYEHSQIILNCKSVLIKRVVIFFIFANMSACIVLTTENVLLRKQGFKQS